MRWLLRLSLRQARRSPGRSTLIVALIALPVLAITGLVTTLATVSVSAREGLTTRMGAADAHVEAFGYEHPEIQDLGEGRLSISGQSHTWTAAELRPLLPGARLVPYTVDRASNAVELDLRDPVAAGMRVLLEGRLPAAPGEVVVSPPLRGTAQKGSVTVVGVVENPNEPMGEEVIGLPGTLLAGNDDTSTRGWLVDAPRPFRPEDVDRLMREGVNLTSRTAPQGDFLGEVSLASLPAVTIVGVGAAVLMVVLETVLLAGPAFAVSLRRRRTELAVIAAQGGSPRHLRAIVITDGLVLGGLAAVAGAGLGLAGGVAAAYVLSRFGSTIGPPDTSWAAVVPVMLLAVVSGLVAALFPAAQAAQQSPAAVLAGRAPDLRPRTGKPLLGCALVAAGVVATVAALRSEEVWILAAMVLVVLGLVALMPWLVARGARLTGRLPLPFRLSARDASRHTARTASAAAAVMAVTTAVMAVGIGYYSNYVDNRDRYVPIQPLGTLMLSGEVRTDAEWAQTKAKAAAALPGATFVTAHEVMEPGSGENSILMLPRRGGRCGPMCGRPGGDFGLPVGDQRLLSFLLGRDDPAAAAAFAEGKVVVFERGLVRDGTVRIAAEQEGFPVDVPAVFAAPALPEQAGAVVPVAAAAKLGLKTQERRLYTRAAGDRRLPLEGVTSYYEGGYGNYMTPQLWALFAVALLLVVSGTFIATRLAAADSRPDLATVHAVGGGPRVRRLVLAGQAGYIAVLGALTGAVAGAVAGMAMAWSLTEQAGSVTIAVPWLFVGGVVVGLPLLAMALAGGLMRNGPPRLSRRLT
ncbi:FtsX-like permease family protein [Nonomuraea sp. NPDC050556]|uniref:FtsX-like permease family protein n=1 Tax=Nonomuraea sp. NPDC050556 TaxID=3364369 RepID=UPI0037A01825